MKRFKAIFKKEMKDSIRDRRAILVAMFPAILGPMLMVSVLNSAVESRREAKEFILPVIGQEYAPDLIAHLENDGITIEKFEGDIKAEIQNKNVNTILAIPEDFGEKFADFQPSMVQLYVDESLDKSDNAGDRVRRLVNEYSQTVGTYRLIVRGVSPALASPVVVETKDYSTKKSRAGQILASLQMIMLMAAFFGGAGVAIDTTAGERERSSLEPLLVHPLSSLEIMSGKWLTVSVYAMAAIGLSVVGTAIGLESISLEPLGIDPKLSTGMQLSLFAMLLPLAFLASSMQMLASLFAKTFKEAQTYLGLLNFLPMLPVIIVAFKELKTAEWMYWVPLLSQQQLMTTVMRGETMSMAHFAIAGMVTMALGVALFLLLTRLLRSERVVYGG